MQTHENARRVWTRTVMDSIFDIYPLICRVYSVRLAILAMALELESGERKERDNRLGWLML